MQRQLQNYKLNKISFLNQNLLLNICGQTLTLPFESKIDIYKIPKSVEIFSLTCQIAP